MEQTSSMMICARYMLYHKPEASAELSGSADFPAVRGRLLFWQTPMGVLVSAQAEGLPERTLTECADPIFALHIHQGESCTGNPDDPFADAGAHYNPTDCPHPYHAGDLPPLFANGKTAWGSFLTGRFRLAEVIGKTVILHRGLDDFTTQPSGNAMEKMACGIIRREK